MTSFFRLGVNGLSLALCVIFLVGCQKEIVVPAHSNQTSASPSIVQSQTSVKSKQKPTSDGTTSQGGTTTETSVSKTKSSATSKTGLDNQSSTLTKSNAPQATTSDSGSSLNTKTSSNTKSTSTANAASASTSSKITQSKSASSSTTDSNQTGSSKSGSSPTSSSNNVETVTVTIKGYNNESLVSSAKVPIQQGWTLLDATLSLLKERNIQYSVRGSGATAYVEGINNEYEFDHGAKSGWIVKKNGTSLTQSAGITSIKPSDTIEWEYLTGD